MKTKLWETVETVNDPESPKHFQASELDFSSSIQPLGLRISNLVDRCKRPVGHLADVRRLEQHCWSLCLATHSSSQTEHLKATQHVRYKTTENEGLCQKQTKNQKQNVKKNDDNRCLETGDVPAFFPTQLRVYPAASHTI